MGDAHPDGLQSPTEEIQVLYTELALHPRKDFGWARVRKTPGISDTTGDGWITSPTSSGSPRPRSGIPSAWDR